jgi:hypothetical protein
MSHCHYCLYIHQEEGRSRAAEEEEEARRLAVEAEARRVATEAIRRGLEAEVARQRALEEEEARRRMAEEEAEGRLAEEIAEAERRRLRLLKMGKKKFLRKGEGISAGSKEGGERDVWRKEGTTL